MVGMVQRPSSKDATRAMVETAADLCTRMPEYRSKSMFGGYGLYSGERIFGLVAHGEIYLRIGEDEPLRSDYEERGSRPFSPDGRVTMAKWWSLPTELYDDPKSFLDDARVALRLSPLPKAKRPSRS